MGGAGLEHPPESSVFLHVSALRGSKSGSISARSGPLGPVGRAAIRWLAGEDE